MYGVYDYGTNLPLSSVGDDWADFHEIEEQPLKTIANDPNEVPMVGGELTHTHRGDRIEHSDDDSDAESDYNYVHDAKATRSDLIASATNGEIHIRAQYRVRKTLSVSVRCR